MFPALAQAAMLDFLLIALYAWHVRLWQIMHNQGE